MQLSPLTPSRSRQWARVDANESDTVSTTTNINEPAAACSSVPVAAMELTLESVNIQPRRRHAKGRYLCCSLLCLLIIWISWAAIIAIQLATTYDFDFELRSLRVGNLCSRSFNVSASVALTWLPWVSVEVVSSVLEARDESTGAVLFNASIDDIRLMHIGPETSFVHPTAIVTLGNATTLAEFAMAGEANLTLSAAVGLRTSLALLPLEHSLEVTRRVRCVGMVCTLADSTLSSSPTAAPPSPQPPSSPPSTFYLSSNSSIRLSHPSPATFGASASVALSLTSLISTIESVSVSLPPIHAELLLAGSTPPTADVSAPATLQLTHIEAAASALLTARTSLTLRAQTAAQGRQWRELVRATLQPDEAQSLVWLRFAAAASTEEGADSVGGQCHFHSVLSALPPLRVPIPVPPAEEYLLRQRRLQAIPQVGDGSTAAWTGLDALRLATSTLRLNSLLERSEGAHAAFDASLGLVASGFAPPLCVEGTLPPIGFTLDADTQMSDLRVALPSLVFARDEADAICASHEVFVNLNVREGLARLVAGVMSGGESATAALGSRTIGPNASASEFPGLAELRVPAQWMAPLFKGGDPSSSLNASGSDATHGDQSESRVDVTSVRLRSSSLFDNRTWMHAGVAASIYPGSMPIPDWLRVRIDATEVTARIASPPGSGSMDDEVRLALHEPMTLGADQSRMGTVSLNASFLPRRLTSLSTSEMWQALSVEGVMHGVGTHTGRAIALSGRTVNRFINALSNVSSVDSSGSIRDGGRDTSGLNVSVILREDASRREVTVALDLRPTQPLRMPLAVGMERVSLTLLWADGFHPNPLASADVHALTLTPRHEASLGLMLAFSASHRAALEQLSQRLIDGETRLCIHGGVGAVYWGAPEIDVCVASSDLTSGDGGKVEGQSANAGGDESIKSLGSVQVLRSIPRRGTIPCILPGPLCPPVHLLRRTLEAADPLSVMIALRLESAALADKLPDAWLVRICVPDVGVRVRASVFEPVFVVLDGGCHVLMRGTPLDMSARLNVTDWYAASRVIHELSAVSAIELQPSGAGREASALEHVLPCLRVPLGTPGGATPAGSASASSASLVTLPRAFSVFSREGTRGDMELISTTRHNATLRFPIGLTNPLPVALLLPAARAEIEYEGTVVATAAFEDGTAARVAPGGNATLVALAALLGADARSCQRTECYEPDALAPMACAPCALARLLASLSAKTPTNMTVRLKLSNDAVFETGLIAFTDERMQIDSTARCADRRACSPSNFNNATVTTSNASDPFGNALTITPDVSATMYQVLSNMVPGGTPASLSAMLDVQFINVLTVPFSLRRVQTDVYLQDVDGVGPYGALMSIPLVLPTTLLPSTSVLIASRATVTADSVQMAPLAPGQQSPMWRLAVESMSMESMARVVDELYAHQQMCITLDGGLADVALQCTGDACTGDTDQFVLTLPLSMPRVATLKPRACHVPSTCVPNTIAVGGRDGSALAQHEVSLSGNAAIRGGQLQLVDGVQERGSAFLFHRADDLMHGFTTTFRFEIVEPQCIPRVSNCMCTCHDPDESTGGFAFVLQRGGAGATGEACHPPTQPHTSSIYWQTRIACAGYAGLGPHSIGVVFSSVDNQLWTTHLSTMSDYERGGIALFVNGETVPVGESSGHGIAQLTTAPRMHAGPHVATITYTPSTRMLYVFLDGHPQPALFAQLDVAADLRMDADTSLWAGFTATSGSLPLRTSVWEWRLGATVNQADATRLEQEGEVAGRVGSLSRVTLDLRDSCGLPTTRGGATVVVSSLVGPSGDSVLNATVHDQGDGRHDVHFLPVEPGLHLLHAAIGGAPTRSFTFDVLDLFAPRCATTQAVSKANAPPPPPPSPPPPPPPSLPPAPPSPSPPPPPLAPGACHCENFDAGDGPGCSGSCCARVGGVLTGTGGDGSDSDCLTSTNEYECNRRTNWLSQTYCRWSLA